MVDDGDIHNFTFTAEVEPKSVKTTAKRLETISVTT